MGYNFSEIEKKWQNFWKEQKVYKVSEDSSKPKYYVLDMFPYPSGSGLSVGHPLGYIASDIIARYKRLNGYNVLHPMGYDSFGLPTEHYAIQTGIHPSIATKNNTSRYRDQLDKIGFSYDWDREVQTSNPKYYKWTQWIFRQLFDSCYDTHLQRAFPIQNLVRDFEENGNFSSKYFTHEDVEKFDNNKWKLFSEEEKQKILLKYRLAYISNTLVNWCPKLGTVLANDEVKDGVSERGGYPVEQRMMKQWSLGITAYAERLLSALDRLDWTDSMKETQRNWIGKSEGCVVSFEVIDCSIAIEVFTTRPDTIYGVNIIVLSPEHPELLGITNSEYLTEVKKYVKKSGLKSELDRKSNKEITGVFIGAYATHPFTKQKIPIWAADYVLPSYGTGAVMSVPCGDARDWDFAHQFNLDFVNVFDKVSVESGAYTEKNVKITNSEFLNGLNCDEAIGVAIKKIQELNIGHSKINYRLRDAVFSRQRYWGEPFPVYYKDNIPYLIDGDVNLPKVDKYLPTDEGDPPLARAKKEDWNIFNGDRMEHSVMPGWAGSSWYFLRFMDPHNKQTFCSKEKSDYWREVDLYIGGAEHAVGHLLYSRFWTKFLFDRKFISFNEPFLKLINQGMILGRSNFVYRIKDTNTFVSYDLKESYETSKIHVEIGIVENDILNIEKFKEIREEYRNAEFILNKDGEYLCGYEVEKMSKSKFNVQSPDEIVEKYGADTLRLYEMFLGPLEQYKPWNINGISGVHNFLKKTWKLLHDPQGDFQISNEPPNKEDLKIIHQTIKKVKEDIERYSFNTVVSTLMICLNKLIETNCINREIIQDFIILLSPYAPHISEEIWSKMGNDSSIVEANFPLFDESYIIEEEYEYPISFNGKTRFKISLSLQLTKDQIKSKVLNHEKTINFLEGKVPKKTIIIPNRIVNFVV
ncbi:MAG: leucine--tRNA ligase [Flavobacteriales bacterium]|nr:leucine--tRNA ligase [Flavobacteriales bacterium]